MRGCSLPCFAVLRSTALTRVLLRCTSARRQLDLGPVSITEKRPCPRQQSFVHSGQLASRETRFLINTLALASVLQVSPHINVNPTITGPTTTISGPSTNISGPNTTTTVSPNMNNAQTGEGNVAPATGTGAGSSGAGAASATATGSAPQPAMQPGMQPGMQSVGMQPSPGYMMMPTPSGQWVMVPMAGSGDYAAAAAAAAAQQQQQQQLMQMAASGGQAMFMPPGGMVGGMPPPNAMPYMMPAHSGGYYPMPGMPHMAAGGPVAGAPVAGFPAPAPAGYPPPPEGYPPPAAGKVMPAEPVKVAAA